MSDQNNFAETQAQKGQSRLSWALRENGRFSGDASPSKADLADFDDRGPIGSPSTPQTDGPQAPRRSSLRRIGAKFVARERAYLRRAMFGLGAIWLVALLIFTASVRWFAPDGPARAFYLFHDKIALPVFAHLWTAHFPEVLIWVIPVAGIASIAAAEYCGLVQPLRRAQVSLLNLALSRGWENVLLSVDRNLRRVGLRAGLAAAVVAERLAESRNKSLERVSERNPRIASDLVMLARLHFLLGDQGMADAIMLLEVVALAQLVSAEDRAAARVLEPLLKEAGFEAPTPRDLLSSMDATAHLRGQHAVAAVLAQLTLEVTLGINDHGRPEALAWFDIWARLWADPATPANLKHELSCAEGFIAFEVWAAEAERRVRREKASDLVARAFPESAQPRSRGEVFARDGVEPQPFSGGSR